MSAPELSASRPGAVCVGPGALFPGPQRVLCRASALYRHSLSGPGALCVGPRRSLCRGPPLSSPRTLSLSVSGPGALCVGARSVCVGPRTLSVGPRRSLTPVLSVSGGTLCVGNRCCLCQGPAFSCSLSGPNALFLSGPGSLCWGPRPLSRSQRSPGARCVGARLSCCVAARHSLWRSLAPCRGPAVSVSRPDPRCVRAPLLCWAQTLSRVGPGALCVGASLVENPALSVSGPGALRVRPRGSMCRARRSLPLIRSAGAAGPQIRVPPSSDRPQLKLRTGWAACGSELGGPQNRMGGTRI